VDGTGDYCAKQNKSFPQRQVSHAFSHVESKKKHDSKGADYGMRTGEAGGGAWVRKGSGKGKFNTFMPLAIILGC
jgi:hypothetical protein